MRKIVQILSIMLVLSQLVLSAEALEIETDDSSNSVKDNKTGCSSGLTGVGNFDNYSGCGGLVNEQFMIRVTLVDLNGYRVTGTKTIELHQKINDEISSQTTYTTTPFIQYMSYIWNQQHFIGMYGYNKVAYNADKGNDCGKSRNCLNGDPYGLAKEEAQRIYDNERAKLRTDIINGTQNSYFVFSGNTQFINFSKLNKTVNYYKGSNVVNGTMNADFNKVYVTNLFGNSNFPSIASNFSERYTAFLQCLKTGCTTKKINSTENVKLRDFILNEIGYLNTYDSSSEYYKNKYIELDNYRLLVERVNALTFVPDAKGMRMVIGTTKQIANYIAHEPESSSVFGMSTLKFSQAFNLGCQIYSSNNMGVRTINTRNGNCTDSTGSSGYYGELMENVSAGEKYANKKVYQKMAEQSSIYGVNIVNISEHTDEPKKVYCNININTCNPASSSIEATTTDTLNQEPLYYCIYNQDEFKENDTTYCIDQLSYDFSNLTSSELSNSIFYQSQYVPINGFNVKNKRICYMKTGTGSGSADKTYFSDISLYLFDRTYTYRANETSQIGKVTDVETIGVGPDQVSKITYEYTTYYSLTGTDILGEPSRLFINIPTNEATTTEIGSQLRLDGNEYTKYLYIGTGFAQKYYTNSLRYSNTQLGNIYGTNRIMSKLGTGTYIKEPDDINDLDNPGDGITRIYKLTTNGSISSVTNRYGNQRCYFNNSIEDGIDINEDIKFRVISLSNPFPAQDGTTRIPGINWLNDYNNVYNYITNNRNIQENRTSTNIINPEMMYLNKTPLYTITLNAANMIKIRNYNKTNNYNNIKLDCKPLAGRECTSKFLRNTTYIPSLTGTCSSAVLSSSAFSRYEYPYKMIVDNLKCQKEYQEKATLYKKDISRYCGFDSSWDLNSNGKIDEIDKIMAETYLTNKTYYSCADKTAASGG